LAWRVWSSARGVRASGSGTFSGTLSTDKRPARISSSRATRGTGDRNRTEAWCEIATQRFMGAGQGPLRLRTVEADDWIAISSGPAEAATRQVMLGTLGPSSAADISFGPSGDTTLHRIAQDALRTDDKLLTGGGLGVRSRRRTSGEWPGACKCSRRRGNPSGSSRSTTRSIESMVPALASRKRHRPSRQPRHPRRRPRGAWGPQEHLQSHASP
jgi:hypothetical protein